MELNPRSAAVRHELLPGVVALPGGLLWLDSSRALVAADAHFAYEDAIGAALPLWSTADEIRMLIEAIDRTGARELILLGDVVHSSRLSDGAAAVVSGALASLRERCRLSLVAGNHEGRTRGVHVLGETFERLERDGWLLVHGDVAVPGTRRIVGHLHPSLPLARGRSVPVFLYGAPLVVVPALTPYSRGLNVLSDECARALRAFVAPHVPLRVVATTAQRLFPFGALGGLRSALRRRPLGSVRQRNVPR